MIQTSLTQAQKTALKADMGNNTTTITATYDNGQQVTDTIAHFIANLDGTKANAIAAWYNLTANPAFFGNYSQVPLSTVRGAISWKKLTSNVTMPASPSTDVAALTWINACLSMQANLELLIGTSPSGVLDATQRNIWQGLQDALSAVPSKAGGVTQDAGWATLQPLLCRTGSNAEKLFADTTNGNGSTNLLAASFVFEGTLSGVEVVDAEQNG